MTPDVPKVEAEEPSVGGVKMRPPLTLVLYGLLVLSAAVALWAQRTPTDVPAWVSMASPWVFLIFALGFAAYRFALVAVKRYSAFKAFFQVAVTALFFLLLLPGSVVAPPRPGPSDLVGLMRDNDARVRALAAELSRYRTAWPEAPRALVRLLKDPDPDVRRAAHESLVQLNSGQDLGENGDAWGQRFP